VSRTRVLVVDDHQVFADALTARLGAEADIQVVGTATSAADAERMTRKHSPDLLVVDVELGDSDGLDLAAQLRARGPDLRVVVVTAHDEVDVACRAVRLGASAFVAKDATFDDLTAAIRGAMKGETWIPPRLLTGVLQEIQTQRQQARDHEVFMSQLTPREREVLICMVSGLDRAGIAKALSMSVDTVRTHTQHMFAKLSVHSSLEAVGMALRAGVRAPETRIELVGQAAD